jgi:predicted ATP-binding protein involved in virulence
MHLQSVTLRNFRCFENITVDFEPSLTVLVGDNGCGKSSLLNAITPLFSVIASTVVYLNSQSKDIRFVPNIITLSGDNIPYGADSGWIQIGYTLDNITLNYSIDLTNYALSDNVLKIEAPTVDPAFHDFVASLLNKAPILPVVVYYSSNRFIPSSDVKITEQSLKPKLNAYDNIADSLINYKKILSWFNDLNNKEALEIRKSSNLEYRLNELELLRHALSDMMLEQYEKPDFDLDIGEIVLWGIAEKKQIPVSKLSQGFQSIFLLIMDLLYRMVVANSKADFESDNLLHTPGIVLIDEVDLHLHPSWQQKILPLLMKTFPKIQFIVTTHSPQVLTSIEPQHIVLLDRKKAEHTTSKTYGTPSSHVLYEVLGATVRPNNSATSKLTQYIELINQGKGEEESALKLRRQLNNWLGRDDIALMQADFLIRSLKGNETEENA